MGSQLEDIWTRGRGAVIPTTASHCKRSFTRPSARIYSPLHTHARTHAHTHTHTHTELLTYGRRTITWIKGKVHSSETGSAVFQVRFKRAEERFCHWNGKPYQKTFRILKFLSQSVVNFIRHYTALLKRNRVRHCDGRRRSLCNSCRPLYCER